jgi:hypothetical protein
MCSWWRLGMCVVWMGGNDAEKNRQITYILLQSKTRQGGTGMKEASEQFGPCSLEVSRK